MAEIITVSVSTRQKQWLQETKSSPSTMLQNAIEEEIKAANEYLAPNLKEARARIAKLSQMYEDAMDEVQKLKGGV